MILITTDIARISRERRSKNNESNNNEIGYYLTQELIFSAIPVNEIKDIVTFALCR